MIAVAVVAGLLGLDAALRSRVRAFRARAEKHLSEAARLTRWRHPPSLTNVSARIEHNVLLYIRNKRASRFPWLTVGPEPPEPPP